MDDRFPIIKVAGAAILCLVLIYALGFAMTGGDLAIYQFWAPKQENAKRQVFEQSQSYVEGKIQNIGQLCFAEARVDGNQKLALDAEIRNEAATIPAATWLPSDEATCIEKAKGL